MLLGNITIDETTLKNSRRVPKEMCLFVKKKLKIDIDSISDINGHYELLDTEVRIKTILNNLEIVKLVYKESKSYNCLPAINWGYSKGDTYKKTCIILTKSFDDLFENNFLIDKFTAAQINTLYVAITRATHKVFLLKRKILNR